MGRRVLSYCVQRRSVQRGGTGLQTLLGLVSWQIQYGVPTYVQYLTLLTYICPPPFPTPGMSSRSLAETQRPRDPETLKSLHGTVRVPRPVGCFRSAVMSNRTVPSVLRTYICTHAGHASDSRGCRHSGQAVNPGRVGSALCIRLFFRPSPTLPYSPLPVERGSADLGKMKRQKDPLARWRATLALAKRRIS